MELVVLTYDGHWIWTGTPSKAGYGQVFVPGPTPRSGKTCRTHRVVWEHHNGPIPEGLVLDHLCCVPLCCNPAHLEPVTQAENRRRQSLRRTACDQGHDYTTENTHIGPNGRSCRICHAERESARRVRQRPSDYATVCSAGHVRTPDNTVAQGQGLRCRECTAEAARERHRLAFLLKGSGK